MRRLHGLEAVLVCLAIGALTVACSRGEKKIEKCHKPQEYQQAKPGPRLRVPEDMESLDSDERLRLPYGQTQSKPIAKSQPCLAEPPEF